MTSLFPDEYPQTVRRPAKKDGIERTALISGLNDEYRYLLTRRWGDGKPLVVIGLNPSIADGTIDDPTITRCIGYAKAWGFPALHMINLYAFRATKPADLFKCEQPVGPMNETIIRQQAEGAGIVLAAWGTHGARRHPAYKTWGAEHGNATRADIVSLFLQGTAPLYCLGKCKNGEPVHPLMQLATLQPVEFLKGVRPNTGREWHGITI